MNKKFITILLLLLTTAVVVSGCWRKSIVNEYKNQNQNMNINGNIVPGSTPKEPSVISVMIKDEIFEDSLISIKIPNVLGDRVSYRVVPESNNTENSYVEVLTEVYNYNIIKSENSQKSGFSIFKWNKFINQQPYFKDGVTSLINMIQTGKINKGVFYPLPLPAIEYITAAPKIVSFANGKGVRYVSLVAHEKVTVSMNGLFGYRFLGYSGDYFFEFFYPIQNAGFLEWPQYKKKFEAIDNKLKQSYLTGSADTSFMKDYYNEIDRLLSQEDVLNSLDPKVKYIDELIRSIKIKK